MGGDAVPERRYTKGWWKTLAGALAAIDPHTPHTSLTGETLRALGPYILGKGAWELIQGEHFTGWISFKRAVDKRFGKSEEVRERTFNEIMPLAGESGADFVLRADDERRRMEITEDEAYIYFYSKIP